MCQIVLLPVQLPPLLRRTCKLLFSCCSINQTEDGVPEFSEKVNAPWKSRKNADCTRVPLVCPVVDFFPDLKHTLFSCEHRTPSSLW